MFNRGEFRDLCNKAAKERDFSELVVLTISPTHEELNPGDRVMGVEDSGKPTWEFGTVEQTNEDDAVVKWDGDGRRKLDKDSLQKI